MIEANKYCPDCKNDLPNGRFGKCAARPDGLQRTCRSCVNAYATVYRDRHPERAKTTYNRWVEKNPGIVAKRNKKFYDANREAQKARARAYRDANPEAHKAATAAWREANAERFEQMKAAWRAANVDHLKAERRRNYAESRDRELAKAREWKRENPHLVQAAIAKRTAARLKAIPAWADHDAIAEIYRRARQMTDAYGIKFHVDHIVPLQSPLVAGLHWEGNLQILPGALNQSKSNRHWPGMIGEQAHA
jgi:hypothetical protein